MSHIFSKETKNVVKKTSMRMILFLCGIFGLLVVTSCATTNQRTITKIQERKITIPQSLLTCMPEPTAKEVWVSEKDVGKFILELAEAGEDCRIKLKAIKKYVN